MEDDDERHEVSSQAAIKEAPPADSSFRIRTDEVERPIDAPVMLTSRSASALGFLTGDLIMSRLGVYEPMSTKELILRDEGLLGIQDECAHSLMALEIFSLSHNKLTSLQGFQYLSNLIELNLNFNQITSLDYLQCFGLEKLFLSNNHVVDISPLKQFTKLTTLSLYGNLISDLDTALSTCRSLPKLRCLDLGGNPCSQEADGYKFQVVRFLPRLKILDGDQLTQLDKDLADEFVMEGRPATADPARPSTAMTIGTRPLTATPKPWETDAPPSTPSKPYDPFTSKHMPKGNVRLFRDDFLNNNPILLEYLAQETQATPQVQCETIHTSSDDDTASLQRSSSFVDKMRSANPLENGQGDQGTSDSEHKGNMENTPPPVVRPKTALTRPNTAGLSTGIGAVLTTNLGIDPSDPKSTIRKLLKHIELLEESLASYKTRHVDASECALLEENRRLQTENNNIPILQDEIASLKKQLSAASGFRPPAPTSVGAGGDDTKKRFTFEHENEQLQREVQRLRQLLKSHEVASTELTPNPPASSGTATTNGSMDVRTDKPKRLGDSLLLEDSASIDVELTELILQNEVSLEMIRNDIKNTKKEWEEQFQAAKERERQRVRPQTALGLLHSTAARGGLDTLTELGGSGDKSVSSVGKVKAPTLRSRQLHTSAGFHHGSGPEERLLLASQSSRKTSSSTNGRSVTNVLTL